eukprot:TRINITY_DN10101_c0_g1_i2.p2 TRINITY_DN10101_c0_g1~~TRINITY_DN10101_c0_g1_i2.p2  ORF type:complete len:268 (+),score=21.08 TRINITY_DN10101_c0_g1_i2:46-849(+)
MAVGKNKRISKGKGKGKGKKVIDPFTRKEWYDVKAPSMFVNRNVGKTLVNKTQGTKIASDALKGRVYETCLADLQNEEEHGFRKVRLRVEDVQGKNCLTNFWGMDITTDKVKSLIRKRQTLIEAHVDVKTTDGYSVRLFCIAFTDKTKNQRRATNYAQSSQVRRIRRKMMDIMVREAQQCTIKVLVQKLIAESLGSDIEKYTRFIYPLRDCLIRKVKVLKAPKMDIQKLMEVHEDYSAEDAARAMEAMAGEEEPQDTAEEQQIVGMD